MLLKTLFLKALFLKKKNIVQKKKHCFLKNNVF